MTLGLMEKAVDDVKDCLETGMESKLDELDTEYGDGIMLVDIKSWYVAEQVAIPEYPSIFVLGDYTEVDGETAGMMRSVNHLRVIVFISDQNLENLRRRLYRYVRAVVELLIAARSSEGWGYAINFERFDYSPIYAGKGTYLADTHIAVNLVANETHSFL